MILWADVRIRWCSENEIEWVNGEYQKVEFKPSSLNTDRVAIAFHQNERVGLGRLCHIEGSIFELGGIYVQPSYRGLGIARQIVRFLLEDVETGMVYCLPFAHLQDFYANNGFRKASEEALSMIPSAILEKYRWCQEAYSDEVLLLQLTAESQSGVLALPDNSCN